MQPQFIVEQKITAFVNQYSIFRCTPDGSKGELCAYAQQKRFNIKEKVLFYTDETKQQQLFSFRAEKALDIHGRYFVEDTEGTLLGTFKKDFTKSLLSSTWYVLDSADAHIFTATESNTALAAIRRYVGYIPFIGDFADIIAAFFKYHFVFSEVSSGSVVGMYRKTTLFRDHYRLDFANEAYDKLDSRVFMSIAVGLDALQSR